jgi:hypothetical protein
LSELLRLLRRTENNSQMQFNYGTEGGCGFPIEWPISEPIDANQRLDSDAPKAARQPRVSLWRIIMIKRISIMMFVISFFTTLTVPVYANDIAVESGKLIESFEWDATAHSKVETFRKYESTYISFLQTNDDERVFIGSVMLGLLKSNQAGQILMTLKSKGKLSEIGIAFALCSLRLDYEKNYTKLEKIGRESQMAGSARSLARLDAVELLSFLPDERFPKYAASLITDEVFQSEAIDVALERFKSMKK